MSLTGIMTLLYISILCFAACVGSISADDHVSVSAKVGSTVALPCKLKNAFTETSLIRWKIDEAVVFERSSESKAEGEGYEGRVDVPEDELHKGNCSLVLKNVRITDDGATDNSVYRSFVMEHVDRNKAPPALSRVKLSIDMQIISARVGSTAVLPCEWRDPSIQTPYVEWYIDSKVVFERKGKESFPGEGYEGRVDVPEDELRKGNCSLVLRNVSVTDEAIYKSSMLVEHTKEQVLIQKVRLSVSVNDANKEIGAVSEGSDSQQSERNRTFWIPIMIVMCVCAISVLIRVFCSRVHGKSGSSCGCYKHTTDDSPTEKKNLKGVKKTHNLTQVKLE
ncbi:butyrophilin subfamily 1 member A1-like isoform X3 [Neoarius graeffei]|uniref:butyrophilin subfamily 1 member A1-like isoform X3 n=1 Tax=Neoarius graeffei TaxID=443677 RepID=UPI00298CBF0E|nr:butyrophilin subfamily 1 member A1-like isoform X3 [Neoarius graeffei]